MFSRLWRIALTVLVFGSPTLASTLIFDSMSNVTTWSTTTSPNTFMGAPFVPAANLPMAVTGLDVVLANTGAAINANNLVLNVYFWDSTTAAISGTDTVFSSLAGSESISFGPRTINAASKTIFQDATSPGVVPAITLPSAMQLDGSAFGLTFNWKADTGSGLVSVSGLTTALRSGNNGGAPAVGTNPINDPDAGYYKNSNRTDGNFVGNDWRNNGTNTNVGFRVYAPEPSASMLFAITASVTACRRRR